MSEYIKLLRPKQWTKNLLVFAALLFTHSFTNPVSVTHALLAFVAMCLISSAVYAYNDVRDAEKDRNHPVKKKRPVASGAVPAPAALGLGALVLAAGLAIAFWLGPKMLILVGVYLVLQVLYNLGAKNVPVFDVFMIGTGFVLRAAVGAAAINVRISAWLLLCTGALALLIGFGKRRSEFVTQGERRIDTRSSLGDYTREALDSLLLLTSAAAALTYGIYALESPTARKYPALIVTVPFVFYGICRYVFLVFSRNEGGEPESLLFKDPHLIVTILLFIAGAAFAVSGIELPLLEINGGAQ